MKGTARRKKCKVRSSLMKKKKAFHRRYMKVGVKEDATCGNDASKNVEGCMQ